MTKPRRRQEGVGPEGGAKERGERDLGKGQDRAPGNEISPLTTGEMAVLSLRWVKGVPLDPHCLAET